MPAQEKTASKLRTWILFSLLIGVAVVAYSVPWMFRQLRAPVTERCAKAQLEFGGDCVEALAELAGSKNHSYIERNQAVWALGQLADERALPALLSLQSDVPCERPCRRDKHLCQYEVEKAIKWCRQGTLFSRWMRASVLEPVTEE